MARLRSGAGSPRAALLVSAAVFGGSMVILLFDEAKYDDFASAACAFASLALVWKLAMDFGALAIRRAFQPERKAGGDSDDEDDAFFDARSRRR